MSKELLNISEDGSVKEICSRYKEWPKIILTNENYSMVKHLQDLHPEYTITELVNQIIYKYFDNRCFEK